MHSLACGQSLLKRSLMPMHQIMGEPVFPVEESVYVCLAQVRKLMEHLDENFQKIEAPIVRIRKCGSNLDFSTPDPSIYSQTQAIAAASIGCNISNYSLKIRWDHPMIVAWLPEVEALKNVSSSSQMIRRSAIWGNASNGSVPSSRICPVSLIHTFSCSRNNRSMSMFLWVSCLLGG